MSVKGFMHVIGLSVAFVVGVAVIVGLALALSALIVYALAGR